MNAWTIVSTISTVLALLLAGIALWQSKTANTHADEANKLAAKASTLAEQARRDAKNAPAEQARQDLYRQIDHAFTTVTTAITTTGDDGHDGYGDYRPRDPLPAWFDDTLAELRRLHDDMPATPLHHGIAGVLDQLDHARTCWQNLHNAQDVIHGGDPEIGTYPHIDYTKRGDIIAAAHESIEREQRKMSRSRDVIKEKVEHITPELRALIYGKQT